MSLLLPGGRADRGSVEAPPGGSDHDDGLTEPPRPEPDRIARVGGQRTFRRRKEIEPELLLSFPIPQCLKGKWR